MEEMGMSCTLTEQFSFIYKAKLDNDLFEHELDHVFFGKSNEKPVLNIDEVADYKYMSIKAIQQDLIHSPQRYTAWFKICFDEVVQKHHLEN